MGTHKGFSYKRLPSGRWQIVLPAGNKLIISASSAEEVRTAIDELLLLAE